MNWTSFDSAFYGCANLTTVSGGNTSNVDSMKHMFRDASLVVPTTTDWDTSKVESMEKMFRNAYDADPDVSGWNTSSVKSMKEMFFDAQSANPDVSGWDTSNVENLRQMFESADNANPDTSSWNLGDIAVHGLNNLFFKSDISNENYSKFLIMANNTATQTGINLGFVGKLSSAARFYTGAAATAHSNLTTGTPIGKGWNIQNNNSTANLACGNDVLDVTLGETCDDGNTIDEVFCDYGTMNCNTCNSDCTATLALSGSYCGDGLLDSADGEECDDGEETVACNSNCTVKSENAFISTWETTGPNETITIPTTGGGYSYIIDWGDPHNDSDDGQSTAENPTHTYSQAGEYTITISGTFPRIYFDNGGDKLKIKSISNLGHVNWTSFDSAFYGCANLTTVSGGNTSNVDSMKNMFRDASLVVPDTSEWDTSGVLNMQRMFNNATMANPDTSEWNVANVSDMDKIFKDSGISNKNYSEFLVMADTTSDKAALTLGLIPAKYYSGDATTARDSLTNPGTKNWSINDEGQTTPLFGACSVDGDCTSNNCKNLVCIAGTSGEACTTHDECTSGECHEDNWCVHESGGDQCEWDGDCPWQTGGTCINNQCVNVADSTCFDTSTNGNESDFNCGGNYCPYIGTNYQCLEGQSCTEDNDCASGTCLSNECVDKALRFDGNTYIYFDGTSTPTQGVEESNTPGIDDPSGDHDWSINLWVNTEIDPADNMTTYTLIAQQEDSNDGNDKAFTLKLSNQYLTFTYYYDDSGASDDYFYCDSAVTGVTLTNGDWHMITLTKENPDDSTDGRFYLYVDGTQCKSDEISQNGGAISNLNKIYIGKDVKNNQQAYNGMIDNITFWNKRIHNDGDYPEVSYLYNSGRATNPLINYSNYRSAYYVTNHYNMNIDDNDIIADSGNHGENGNIYYETTMEDYFEYENDTPGGRQKTLKINGLCQTLYDDIEDFELADGITFNDLSLINTPENLDISAINGSGLELHLSDNETENSQVVLSDGTHWHSYLIHNDYFDESKTFITVNTRNPFNTSNCSIRNAIEAWNDAGSGTQHGGCTEILSKVSSVAIIFDNEENASNYNLPYDNALNTSDDNNLSGDLDINRICDFEGCSMDLEILGCGSSESNNTTLNGYEDHPSRILDIRNQGINLSLKNMRLINGNAVNGMGGAIRNKGTLTLENITFMDNIAQGEDGEDSDHGGGGGGAAGMGGAIFNDYGFITIRDEVTFKDNQAIGGDGGDGGTVSCTGMVASQAVCDYGTGGIGGSESIYNGSIVGDVGTFVITEPTQDHDINSGGHGGISLYGEGTTGTNMTSEMSYEDGGFGGGAGGSGVTDYDNEVAGLGSLFRAGSGGKSMWTSATSASPELAVVVVRLVPQYLIITDPLY